MWAFNSLIGPIYIKYSSGEYGIEINDVFYGGYKTPESAADDVYMFSTGCYEWDSLASESPHCPDSLSEWEKY